MSDEVLLCLWHRTYSPDQHREASVWLRGIQIGRIAWHYRGGRNSMYCCFFVNGKEMFFSKTPEAVLRKFKKFVRLPIREVQQQ